MKRRNQLTESCRNEILMYRHMYLKTYKEFTFDMESYSIDVFFQNFRFIACFLIVQFLPKGFKCCKIKYPAVAHC